jgi:hypothetical protein
MLLLNCLLLGVTVSVFMASVVIVVYDLFVVGFCRSLAEVEVDSAPEGVADPVDLRPLRWRTTLALLVLAWIPILVGLSIFGMSRL